MPSNTYTVGDQLTLTAMFTDPSGVLVDPTAVTISVHKPSGTIITPSTTRTSVGTYQATQALDTAGNWKWKAVGTGAAVAASSPEQGNFRVEPQSF